jgi:hypothetical protein
MGEPCVTVKGNGINETVPFGELRVFPLDTNQTPELTIEPAKGFDVGAGKGKTVVAVPYSQSAPKDKVARLESGLIGLIIDCRGRPLAVPEDAGARREWLRKSLSALGLRLP